MKSYAPEWIHCDACDLTYEPTRRALTCPHVPTTGESSYLSALREQGPPYKFDERENPKP
jgi:hypothetical protein